MSARACGAAQRCHFARDLADALARRFGMRVPVVDAPIAGACIVEAPVAAGGDPYSGHSLLGRVELLRFVRPDGGGAMSLTLEYLVHETSGQLDAWELTARGFAGTGLEPLLQPRGAPWVGTTARIRVDVR